jgi:methionyl-tRNA synthetase
LAAVAAEVVEENVRAWERTAPHEALEATWRLIGAANALLESTEPWKLPPGPECDAVLGAALEVLRLVAVLIVPAMPTTASEIWRRIGLDVDPGACVLSAVAAWGGYPGGLPVMKGEPLFPRRKG